MACHQCGSSNFHLDAGQTFCANGHEQFGGHLVAAEDEADFLRNQGGKLHRDSRKDTKNAKDGKVHGGEGGMKRVLRGREAWELWAKAWGVVLWRVVWEVGRVVGGEEGVGKRGDEVWEVVRGLWALRLGELVERWEEMGEGAAEASAAESEDPLTTDNAEDEDVKPLRPQASGKMNDKNTPKLIDTLALNYLALLLLRHPISLSTLYNHLQTEALPHLRAIRQLPAEIRDRLPPEYHRALDTVTIPQPEDLQVAIYRNAKLYRKQFGMVFPLLNWRPLLLEWVQKLALPLQVYGIVKTLNSLILDFEFAYPPDVNARRSALGFPEAQLMSLLVVAVKLLFPFDAGNVKRYPRKAGDEGMVRVDWGLWVEGKEWFEAQVRDTREEVLVPGTEMGIRDGDVLDMSGEEVDAYMDWYQRMWMSGKVEEGSVGVQRELLGMFPVKDVGEDDAMARALRREDRIEKLRQERLAMVLGGLKARKVVTDEDLDELEAQQPGIAAKILRPGMRYQVFNRVEDLEGPAKHFHEEAAATACLSLRGLLKAVAKTESKIEKWRREKRREEAFADDLATEGMDLDATSQQHQEPLSEAMAD